MADLKKEKNKTRLFKWGTLASFAGVAVGGYNFLQKKIEAMNYKRTYEPEAFEPFRELFDRYDCDKLVEFNQYLRENSTLHYDWIVLNDELKQVAYREYNPAAQVAVDEYAAIQNHFGELVMQDPLTYLDIAPSEVAVAVAIPTLFMAGYLVQRHKYKKLCKEVSEMSQGN